MHHASHILWQFRQAPKNKLIYVMNIYVMKHPPVALVTRGNPRENPEA